MPEPKRPLKVFLCHASQDKPLVRELSRQLVGEGWIDTWLDEKSLLPGQDWRIKIEEAVEDSDIVIICLSNNSVTKEGYVQKELRYAREIALEKPEETIFIIPLRLEECEVPRGLRFYQWVDYFGERKDESYKALVESLRLRHEQKLELEEAGRARKEKIEREIAERAAREKEEREAAERIAQERVAREQAKKQAEEKARLETEEKAWQKAAKEKAEKEAAEKATREKAEKEAAEKACLETEGQARKKVEQETALDSPELKSSKHESVMPTLKSQIATISGVIVVVIIVISLLLFALQGNLFGLKNEGIPGSAIIEAETRTISGITSMTIDYPVEVIILQGDAESVVVETDDNFLPQLGTEIIGTELVIRNTELNPASLVTPSRLPKITVTSKNLSNIYFSTPGTISIDSFVMESLRVDLTSRGVARITNLDVQEFTCNLNFMSDMHVDGAIDSVTLTVDRDSQFYGANLLTKTAYVTIGSGTVDIRVQDWLDVEVTGSGNVNYYGSPGVSKAVTGTGNVSHAGD